MGRHTKHFVRAERRTKFWNASKARLRRGRPDEEDGQRCRAVPVKGCGNLPERSAAPNLA